MSRTIIAAIAVLVVAAASLGGCQRVFYHAACHILAPEERCQ